MASDSYKIKKSLNIQPLTAPVTDQEGDLAVNATTERLVTYIEGDVRELVTNDQSQTLTNKSIDGDQNTITNVGSAALVDDSVTTAKLSDEAVTAAKLAPNAVETDKISDASVTEDKISDEAVTNAKLAEDAVDTDNIVDGAVTSSKIEDEAVTTSKVSDEAVTAVKIAPDAVETSKISDESVTAAKLADEAVTNSKISDGSVSSSKLALDEALDLPEIATPPTPGSGRGRIYFKTDGLLYQLNDDGIETAVGSGSLGGPGSTTDNAIVRWDGIDGDAVKNSPVVVTDAGVIEGASTSQAITVKSANNGAGTSAAVVIKSGDSDGTSGAVTITTGDVSGFNAGSSVTIQPGNTGAQLAPGNVNINTRRNQNGSGQTSGNINLTTGGDSTIDSRGRVAISARALQIVPNQGKPTSGNPNAGDIIMETTGDGRGLVYAPDGNVVNRFASLNSTSPGFVNLVTYSQGLPANISNHNAQHTVGTWSRYADAADTQPVDMTGGSPGTTLTRNTSAPISGVADFSMNLGSGSSRQGEGIALSVSVPEAYRGRELELRFPYKVTGAIVEGDLRLFAYDATNSTLITPFTISGILGASGIAVCRIPAATNTATLRVGVHVARTSTAALSVNFTDVVLTPYSQPVGLAGSDWVDVDSPASLISGASSVTVTYFQERRVGDSIDIRARFTCGTVSGSTLTVTIPGAKTANVTSNTVLAGTFGGTYTGADYRGIVPIVLSASPTLIQFARNASGASVFSPIASNAFANNGDEYAFTVSGLRIAGSSANVSMGDSSTFLISSYLANGTRVTTTPARLGEYRTLIKDNAANTFSDNAPSVNPTGASGMPIHFFDGGGAGTSGEPNRYQIYIGRNKTWRIYGWQNPNKALPLDVSFVDSAGSISIGPITNYDSSSGVLTVSMPMVLGSAADRYLGSQISSGTGFVNLPKAGYFDIQVSENALGVSASQPRSEVFLVAGNGHGSTNTKIRRFSTTRINTGSAITYSDSSTLGASFTVNESGVYSINYSDSGSSSEYFGLTVNDSLLTTNVTDVSHGAALACMVRATASHPVVCSTTLNLSAGDVVRPHTNGTPDATSDTEATFRITKVSN